MNEHEEAARAVKVLHLTAAIRDLSPGAPTGDIAKALRLASADFWTDLADVADVRPPSRTTQARVIKVLEDQADEDMRIAKAKARPGMVMAGQPKLSSYVDDLFAGLT